MVEYYGINSGQFQAKSQQGPINIKQDDGDDEYFDDDALYNGVDGYDHDHDHNMMIMRTMMTMT